MPRSQLPIMPPAPGRSSKEWKASALENARKAEAQALAKRQYQQQLEELQARLKVAEELERENNKQAEIERQAARDQEFEEIKLVKQAEFRSATADEVLTRIAQQLKTKRDYEYIVAVADAKTGFEDPTEFKAMLWEAIAGTNIAYLRELAAKIAERIGALISEDDLVAIEDSVACLDRQTVANLQSSERNDEAIADASAAVEDLARADIETKPGDDAPVPSTEHVKQEDTIPAKRNTMDDIELASSSLFQESQLSADNDTNIELTDALGNIITGEEVSDTQVNQMLQTLKTPNADPHDFPSATRRTSHAGTPQGSANSTRKRAMTEEGTPTPSEAGSTTTPSKKRKPNATLAKTPATKFVDLMEARGYGNVTEKDLLCSKCDSDAENPRVTSTCHHVYCNTCISDLRTEQATKGKKSHDTICCHVACDSKVGTMSQVSAGVIQRLRKSLVRNVDADRDMTESDGVLSETDDEKMNK